jgi:hypothetical protein
MVEIVDLFVDELLTGKIRATDIPDKETVPGEHEPGILAARPIRYQDGHGMGGMARGLDELEFRAPEFHDLAFVQNRMLKGDRRILHVTDFSAGARTQFLVPADMVGMDMGFEISRYSCTSRLGSTTQATCAPGQPMM